MSKPTKPSKGITTTAYTMRYQHPNMTTLVALIIKDGVVTDEVTLSDPDSPMITIAKGESNLWRLYQELRNGY